MQAEGHVTPDSTAVRTALWRAMHVQIDPTPHVVEDEIGLKPVAPDEGWRNRPDMNPQWTRGIRASIAARARFIEDLVTEQAGRGVGQYVILGAGLDTFAQRRPEIASRLRVFEVDRPGPSEWKRQRLIDFGYGVPAFLRLVPVDFEAGASWWERLLAAGFDAAKPARELAQSGRVRFSGEVHADSGGGHNRARVWFNHRDDVHAAERAAGSRGPSDCREGAEGCGGVRDTIHQLLLAAGDAGAGARGRLQRRPARVASDPHPTLG
jgi:hypothetical protein